MNWVLVLSFMYDLVMSEFSFIVKFLSLSRGVFTGKAEAGGLMHVTLCDYIMPWDSLSNTQKKGLSQRYQMGCECKVRQRRTVCVCLVYLPEFHLLEYKSRHNRPDGTRHEPQQQLQQQTTGQRVRKQRYGLVDLN